MVYTLSYIAGGFLAGWIARSQLENRLRGGNLGRDPLVLNEGRTIRGNGNSGPTTPKPNIVPKPQSPAGRVIDVWARTVGYIPRSQGGTPNPPPRQP
jgi:hypothetical protein